MVGRGALIAAVSIAVGVACLVAFWPAGSSVPLEKRRVLSSIASPTGRAKAEVTEIDRGGMGRSIVVFLVRAPRESRVVHVANDDSELNLEWRDESTLVIHDAGLRTGTPLRDSMYPAADGSQIQVLVLPAE